MRRLLRLIIPALLLGGVVGVSVWSSQRPTVPPPPTPPWADIDDPAIQGVLDKAYSAAFRDPSHAPSRALLGMAFEANRFPELARDCYEQACRLEPDAARWWYHLAIVTEDIGDSVGALRAMDRACALDAEYAPARWRKGLWLMDAGDAPAAIEAFTEATTLDPDDANGWYGLARARLLQGAAAQAASILEKLLERVPEDRYALLLLGTAYRQLGRLDDARDALARGRGVEHHWRDAWSDDVLRHRAGYMTVLKKALTAFRQGDYDTMIALLKPWRAKRPDDVALLNNLGMAYIAARRFDEAFEVLGAAVKSNPEHYASYLNLATASFRTGDISRALVHANRAIELNPKLGKAYETKGLILWNQRMYEAALAALQESVRLDARQPQVLVWVGMVQCELKRWADALATFERAARVAPNLAKAYVGIGLAQMELGALEEAEEALRRAASLAPADTQLAAAKAKLRTLRQMIGTPDSGPQSP